MAIRLTDTVIVKGLRDAAASGRRVELVDVVHDGLRIRLSPSGAAAWGIMCRDQAGRLRRFSLGEFPNMGVAAAREAAGAMRHKVRQEGADPTAERRAARQKAAAAKDGTDTLAGLLDLYERQRGAELRSWPEYRRSIGRVFGKFLGEPLDDLTVGSLQLAADSYTARAQASLAVRCLRPVLRWASAPGRGYVSLDLTAIQQPATPKRRDRVLSRDELACILPVLRADATPYAAALLLMLLTLARRSEVCEAQWQDVDIGGATLTVPAERSKNGQAHVIPLSRQAVALLLARRPAEVDPAALVFGTASGKELGNWDRETKRIQEASGTAGWQRHDLRRTGATMLGEMGVLPDIIEAALNHVSIHSQLAATYNRSRYRPQVAAALQRLADALDGIERESTSDIKELVP